MTATRHGARQCRAAKPAAPDPPPSGSASGGSPAPRQASRENAAPPAKPFVPARGDAFSINAAQLFWARERDWFSAKFRSDTATAGNPCSAARSTIPDSAPRCRQQGRENGFVQASGNRAEIYQHSWQQSIPRSLRNNSSSVESRLKVTSDNPRRATAPAYPRWPADRW